MFKIHKRQRGFTLIELLIVVAIIGIIAAILIPNFLDALHKGRQKRTMGDMRQLGLALGMYWTDNGGAAAAGQTTGGTWTESDWAGTASLADLKTALVPDYSATIPEEDGWGHTLTYAIELNNPPRTRYALMISPGRDGSQSNVTTTGTFDPTDFDQDLVWGDGSFLRAPAGSQSSSSGGTGGGGGGGTP